MHTETLGLMRRTGETKSCRKLSVPGMHIEEVPLS